MHVTRIHHLNCGTLRPYIPRIEAILYCLLLETDDGLVLVDTGFGTRDYTAPTRLMRVFTTMMRVPRNLDETAARQIVKLGFATEDVKHIICTHLHLDHTGGLPDFPRARVHVYRPEYEAAMRPRGLLGPFYVQQHWTHAPQWVLHDFTGDTWFDFDAIPLSDSIQLIPLPGHTPGHCGVAIKSGEGWLFHCGDAVSPFYGPTDPHRPTEKQPSRLVTWLTGPHAPRLRQFAQEHRGEIRLISGHDIHSFRELSSEESAN